MDVSRRSARQHRGAHAVALALLERLERKEPRELAGLVAGVAQLDRGVARPLELTRAIALQAELARLDRNINAQEAQLRAMIDDAVRKSAKREGKPDVEVTTRIVDISRSAKEAAKSARPLHYGGHPDLASNGANTADELETEIQELCDEGYSVKSILPLVSGGYSEGWGPDGDSSGEATDVTTLVLVTAEGRADESNIILAHRKRNVFARLSIVHLLHAFVKKLYQHYYRWLLNMLAQSREMLRSDFAPRSIRGEQIDLDGLTMEALRFHLVMALRAAPIPDETIERNMESFFVYFFGNATMAVALWLFWMCVRLGVFVTFEHPLTSRVWRLPLFLYMRRCSQTHSP